MTEEQKQPENLDNLVEGTEIKVEDFLENSDVVSESSVEPESPVEEVVIETDSESDGQAAENNEVFAAFQQENANLKKLLDEKSQQADLVKAQYARLAADFENFRRRTTKEKENLEVQSKKNVITELLPVIDNFERARTQLKPESDGEKGNSLKLSGCIQNAGRMP